MKIDGQPDDGGLVEDRRGQGGSGGGMGGGLGRRRVLIPAGGGGCGTLILCLFLFFGAGGLFTSGFDIDPGMEGLPGPQTQARPGSRTVPNAPSQNSDLVNFVRFVVGNVNDYWADAFRRSGRTYRPARLIIFEDITRSACGGAAEAAAGPHYCPEDENVYLDLSFFRDLERRFGAPGDFAQAYVIAHEYGHHVQNVNGTLAQVSRAQQQNPSRANELQIRVELQADCLAGVWANSTYEQGILEAGDLEEGLRAAAAVGDDRIQRQSRGRVNPETWTHGSSQQRVRWFQTGFKSGNPAACDTFRVRDL